MERNDHPARQVSILLLDRRQQFQLVEIAVHVLDGGDAVPGAIVEATPHHGDILRPFRFIWIGIRLAAGRQTEPVAVEPAGGLQRTERFHLAQLPGRQAIRADDHLIARPQFGAMQHADQFERLGIGPGGVMIGRKQNQRLLGKDRIEMMACQPFCIAKDGVVGALREQDLFCSACCGVGPHGIGQRRQSVHTCKLEMIKFGSA